jgi:hypothetical protein
MEPAGQDSEMLIAARNRHSTAPFAPKCQSFLDNLPVGFGAKGSASDPPPIAQGRPDRPANAADPPWRAFVPAGPQLRRLATSSDVTERMDEKHKAVEYARYRGLRR